jgi:hypothetical protein
VRGLGFGNSAVIGGRRGVQTLAPWKWRFLVCFVPQQEGNFLEYSNGQLNIICWHLTSPLRTVLLFGTLNALNGILMS